MNKYAHYHSLFLEPKEDNQQKIKHQHSKLIKIFHPDKNRDVPPAVFHKIKDAYQILSNPALKMIYDNLGQPGVDLVLKDKKRLAKIEKVLSSRTEKNEKFIEIYKRFILFSLAKEIKEDSLSSKFNYNVLSNTLGIRIKQNYNKNVSFFVSFSKNEKRRVEFVRGMSYSFGNFFFKHANMITFRGPQNITSAYSLEFPLTRIFFVSVIKYVRKRFILPTFQVGYNSNIGSFSYDLVQKKIVFTTHKENTANKTRVDYNFSFGSLIPENTLARKAIKKEYIEKFGVSLIGKKFSFIHDVSSKGIDKVSFNTIMTLISGGLVYSVLNVDFSFGQTFVVTLPLFVISKLNYDSLLIFSLPWVYKKYLQKTHKRYLYELYDEIMKCKQEHFNENNNFNVNTSSFELKIIYAIVGKKSDIDRILKRNEYFGNYRKVFDIRSALNLSIINNKLIIPQNIFDIDGVYVPDHRNKNSLSYYVRYRYRNEVGSVYKENMEKEVTIP